jgi:hypothetical protein
MRQAACLRGRHACVELEYVIVCFRSARQIEDTKPQKERNCARTIWARVLTMHLKGALIPVAQRLDQRISRL